jgi:hypothetical protein
MSNSKTKNFTLVLLTVIIIVGALFMILWRSTDTTREQLPIVTPVPRETGVVEPETRGSQIPSLAQETSLPKEKPSSVNKKEIVIASPVQPDKTPFDPEDQPRTFFSTDFKGLSAPPDGYTLEDLEITDKGITLKPLGEGEESKPRYGVLNSPPQEMQFPSNAVSPLWKQEVSDGTSVFVEVSLSPDGDTWGIWHPIHYDEDAGQPTEFYPDGSPNPNFGYTPGGVLCWGMAQFKYFRYRATLYSETKDSPLLSGFRLFYQDTTLGDGHLADVGEDLTEE